METRIGRTLGSAVAAVAMSAAVLGSASSAAAQPLAIAPLPTSVTAFVGVIGAPGEQFVSPGTPLFNQDQFTHAYPSASVEMTKSVQSFFASGGEEMSAYPSSSNAPADLNAALETVTTPVNSAQPANLIVVPALATLNGEDYYSVAVKTDTMAATLPAMALLDLPQQVVQAASAGGDVAGPMSVADTLVTRMPSPASASIYTSPLTDPDDGSAVSAAGFAAGLFSQTDARFGYWVDPAGDALAMAGYVPQWLPTDAAAGDMETAGLNSFRRSNATGAPVLSGARTLGTRDQLTRYISIVRTDLYISTSITAGLSWTRFEADSPLLLSQVNATVSAFMAQQDVEGAFGTWSPTPNYVVTVNESNNSVADMAAGIVNVDVAYTSPSQPEYSRHRVTAHAGPGF